MALFAMVAGGRPLAQRSSSSKRDSEYQQWLKRVALQSKPAIPVFADGALYLRVVWFHTYPTREPDVDNILKPIADALEGIVYPEDRLLVQCLCERVYVPAADAITLSPGEMPAKVFEDLLVMLSGGYNNILYIEVGRIDLQGIRLGVPIGGIR